GRRQDVERLQSQIDGAEQREFQQLQVPLVAGRQLRANAERLDEAGEAAGRAAADQLEHVRVALLRHDRGARGEGLRELQQSELLRVEQQHVCREAAEILHEQRRLEEQLSFGLPARQLHRGDGLVNGRELQLLASRVPVDRQTGCSITRGRAQWAEISAAPYETQRLGVVADFR